jgi:glycosyltransferase involved in cell wall biosynthesis
VKRVLVVAYFFPPLGGAGVQRTLKFIRYLPEHGWAPAVVTTSSTAYPVADASLLDEIPAGTRVVRAFEPRPWQRLAGLASAVFARLRLPGLARAVVWPDVMIAWVPAAIVRTVREIRRSRPDVLFSTSAPLSCHLVALAAHKLTGVPWVADFRDEFAANPTERSQTGLRARLSRRIEDSIARHTARRTVVASYFDLSGDGVAPLELPNGVDAADLDGLRPAQPAVTDRLQLSYVGSLYGQRDAEPVLAALRRLIADGRLDAGQVALRVVGNVWLADFESRVPVALVTTGYVSHGEALREMRTATALLLYIPPGDPAPSGKIFEYLVAERPILCVAPTDNLATRLVAECDAGVIAAPDDPDAIEAALLELVRRRQAGELRGSPVARERTLERYSRQALAGRLAEVFEDAARP